MLNKDNDYGLSASTVNETGFGSNLP